MSDRKKIYNMVCVLDLSLVCRVGVRCFCVISYYTIWEFENQHEVFIIRKSEYVGGLIARSSGVKPLENHSALFILSQQKK